MCLPYLAKMLMRVWINTSEIRATSEQSGTGCIQTAAQHVAAVRHGRRWSHRICRRMQDFACAMYAFEKEIPKISEIKLQGLKEFYGLDSKNSTEYFEKHMEADIRHTASWRKIIEESIEDEGKIIQTVTKSVSAQNLLLDSCFEAYC